MFCRVYRLRSEAGKLPRDAVRSTARDAWLDFSRPRSGAPVFYARLSRDRDGAPDDELANASVRLIRRGGIMIAGVQREIGVAKDFSFRQSWWCVPIALTSFE